MAYRLTYTATMSWVGPGMGPIGSPQNYGAGSTGNAQALTLGSQSGGQTAAGGGTNGVINSTDITTLTNAMAADIAAQMNLTANLGKMQGWETGQP